MTKDPWQTSTSAPVATLDIPAGDMPPLDLMPRGDLPVIWQSFRAQLTTHLGRAAVLEITSLEQTAEIAEARTIRLALKSIRCAVEAKRKDLGEDLLRETKRINAAAKELKDLIEPYETKMQRLEDFAELEAARIEQETRAARQAELSPFLTGGFPPVDLGLISAEEYAGLLADTKDLHAVRAAREAREADERAAAAAKAEEEREAARLEAVRVKAENEALRKEAAAKEEALRKEREAAAAEAAKERAAAAAAAAAAKAEADAAIRQSQAAAAAAEQEIARLGAAEKMRKAQESAAAAKAKADAEEAARQAAAAPDRDKLLAFADVVAALTVPLLSDAAKAAEDSVVSKTANFAKWIRLQAASL